MQKEPIFSGKENLHKIEQIIIELLENNQYPDLQSLGGIAALYSQRHEYSDSKVLDEILRALLLGTSNDNTEKNKLVLEIFISGVTNNQDPISLRDTIHLLCKNVERLTGCFKILLELAGNKERPGILRRYYLLGAFEIALHDKSKKHSLIAYLVELESTDDKEFLGHAMKIIGLSYTLFNEDDLFEKLQGLVLEIEDEDGVYEVAMGWMHKALNSETQLQALFFFKKALAFFEKIQQADQYDAGNYILILKLIEGFTNNGSLDDLRSLSFQLALNINASCAYSYIDSSLSWTRLRNSELFNWQTLSYKLVQLLNALNEPAWFEPTLIIEEYLIQIYFSNRSILCRSKEGGVDRLIQPIVREKLLQNAAQIHLLDQWLTKQTVHELWPEANQLRKEIKEYKSSWIKGNEEGTIDHIVSIVPSYNFIPQQKKQLFEEFSKQYRSQQMTGVSKKIISIFEHLVTKLSEIDCFRDPDVNFNFQTVLYYTLYFLEQRMDATQKNFPYLDYLFKNEQIPLESALQKDYFQFMTTMPSMGSVQCEVMDIAGGRADILFNYNSHKFCTEVKRELVDCSFENIKKKYLGQTLEYQNTSTKLGMLLVLDLTDKTNGIGSIESNVIAEIYNSEKDSVKRGTVIVRIHGNRITPSSISLKSKTKVFKIKKQKPDRKHI